MKNTNEELLRDKENRIKTLISHGEIRFIETFDFLHKYYVLNNLSGKAPVISVFEAIYIKNLNLPAWRLAICCNLSRTTLFNYRNKIINDFNKCLTENLVSEQTPTTDGEKV